MLKCLQVVFVALLGILGLAGTAMVFYGGVHTFMVDHDAAKADRVDGILADFVRCDQRASNFTNVSPDGGLYRLKLADCAAENASLLITVGFAGTFTLFAIISAVISNCRDVKGNLYCFSVLSSVSLALLVAGMAVLAQTISPAVVHLAPCKALGLTDLERTSLGAGVVCIDDPFNKTAQTWLVNIGTFYAGCGICIFCLLVSLALNSCCASSKQAESEERMSLREGRDGRSAV